VFDIAKNKVDYTRVIFYMQKLSVRRLKWYLCFYSYGFWTTNKSSVIE